ncbi:MAG TPA: hypothetical protein VM600_03960, partial [Actinomycetota bacterium]|nr:hypothetical protein [Actinomycetota bacterium]
EGVCGVARAAREVRAQDGIFGVAHPEDERRACISTDSLTGVPIDHLEAFRAPHTSFWESNLRAGRRFVPVTGSDNHFKQLYGTDGGTGANTTFVLSPERTTASLIESIRAGRVFSTTRAVGPKLTTGLDANRDGSVDVVTGGWSQPAPAATLVRVHFTVSLGTGHWLQVMDDTGSMVAQQPVVAHEQTLSFDLPATSSYYRGQLAIQPLDRISGPDYLSYEDTLRVLSAPVYLTPPSLVEDGAQATATGASRLSGDVPYAGFADVASDGARTHAVWVERRAPRYVVMHRSTSDDGTTWSDPVPVSTEKEDARMPSVSVQGDRVTVAYENKNPGAHGGQIVVATSFDGGATFGHRDVLHHSVGARPATASSGGIDHVVFMSMENGYKIRYARRSGTTWTPSVKLSSATARPGGMTQRSIPPRVLVHVPAALHPAIAVDGDRVAVAWEDNREDPNPLRNGTPDDWGIYGTASNDAGLSWSSDVRLTPRHDRKPVNPAKPEEMEGNPARHPDLVFAPGGSLFLAYHDRYPSGGATPFVSRSDDGGATWTEPVAAAEPSAEFSYKPKLALDASSVRVVWQSSSAARWSLRTAVSNDAGATFGPGAPFTTGTGYAGYPETAGRLVVWTGESADVYGVYASRL